MGKGIRNDVFQGIQYYVRDDIMLYSMTDSQKYKLYSNMVCIKIYMDRV